MAGTDFEAAVTDYLYEGEDLVAGASLDRGWVALTSRRWLVYGTHRDRLEAVMRENVESVRAGRLTTAGDRVRRAPRFLAYSVVAFAVALAARRVRGVVAIDLAAPDAPGVGRIVSMLALVRTGVDVVATGAALAGVGSLLAALALVGYWYHSRRPAVVVETDETTLYAPGGRREVEAAVARLTDSREATHDPADLVGAAD